MRPKILAVNFCPFKKKNCKPYFIVIMITVLDMISIFWVVNFKTRNYFVIFYCTDESGVTVPKGLFTFYMNVKIVTAKNFWPPCTIGDKILWSSFFCHFKTN
jgi:hypothetical protein